MHLLVLSLLAAAPPSDTLQVKWLGLELQQKKGGEIVVTKADPPAAPTVAAGDLLISVASGDHPGTVKGKSLCDVWQMVMGPVGETVSLKLSRSGKPFDAKVTRTDPPELEEQAKAQLPKSGVPPELAGQLLEAQRNLMRAMALQTPAACGGPAAPGLTQDSSDQVTAFTHRMETLKKLCDLKWIKAQPEVKSVSVSPSGGYSVFMKAGGPPVVMDCDGEE